VSLIETKLLNKYVIIAAFELTKNNKPLSLVEGAI
jgi:hypothetical protein